VDKKRFLWIALLVIVLGILSLAPLVIRKDSTINLLVLVLLYVALASSWNILGGYTGQTNLGHAAFFGLGTLATRLLWLSGWPLAASLLAGGGVAVAFALLIGFPAFKLRGVYFAIGTLALAQILFVTVGNEFPTITALPTQYLASYQLLPRYYVCLALAVVTVGVAYVLVNSRLGLGMMAVREEEEAAESLGVSALRHKLLALGVSAFLAGLAGGAFAYYHVSYYPNFLFHPVWTFDAVMMAYIGGAGTLIGPVIGAAFMVIVKELLTLKLVDMQFVVFGKEIILGDVHLIVFGILFILVVLFLPGGFVEAWEKVQRAVTRLRRQGGPRWAHKEGKLTT
jgi:branched-chain amino acid transport system permease protein